MNKSTNVETDPDDCLNPYSVSKVAGEKIMQDVYATVWTSNSLF